MMVRRIAVPIPKPDADIFVPCSSFSYPALTNMFTVSHTMDLYKNKNKTEGIIIPIIDCSSM
jgi:hypothetical protein